MSYAIARQGSKKVAQLIRKKTGFYAAHYAAKTRAVGEAEAQKAEEAQPEPREKIAGESKEDQGALRWMKRYLATARHTPEVFLVMLELLVAKQQLPPAVLPIARAWMQRKEPA